MTDLLGKTALVTGGSRGIGAAIVRRLARDGADVAFTYVSAAGKAKAEEVVADVEAQGRRAVAIQSDAEDPDAVRDAVDRAARELGRLDILVNNAGVWASGPFEEVTRAELDRVLAIHTRAAFVGSQAASAHLPEGGRIVSIGSNLALQAPFPGIVLYSMSKSALSGFTKALARELGPRGITVNAVHPGSTDTDMNPADGESADLQRGLSALGRYAHADDMAAMVAHLVGPGGRSITGAEFTVDGGTNA
ncbi:SDR family NAD(P)-dependent oxidoreductase [Streptomyces lasiicapitis]|uniref:3-ketoacyl-ACP reductase n=1 Tax=Streptomyces lasiicapitis TaxID=1923961 RepID=A0ABQ2MPX6_9ACTN|nr:SDR family oxidoreductase [Streptomyces lasiicapitis]GGO56577.1 3-ketoacyl-ACP reductase [Streptomyces lasiicapitis]